MKHNLVIKPRASDYVLGSNSPLMLKSVSDGDWTTHQCFDELQRNPLFDDDGCAPYYANKNLDVWMDFLMPSLPASVTSQLQPFMQLGRDGLGHFHSSPWFTENLTGNGQNGNSLPECMDVIRKYGAIPYSEFNFTDTTTPAEYFVAPTAEQLGIGVQFLSLMGGKNFLQYHWIANDSPKNLTQMESAIMQSPLGVGIAVAESWNQETPAPDPLASTPPQHALLVTKIPAPNTQVSDNYLPYVKFLDEGYPINYILQAIVSYIVPIEQTILATTATVVQDIATSPATPAQKLSWLQSIALAIKNLFNS